MRAVRERFVGCLVNCSAFRTFLFHISILVHIRGCLCAVFSVEFAVSLRSSFANSGLFNTSRGSGTTSRKKNYEKNKLWTGIGGNETKRQTEKCFVSGAGLFCDVVAHRALVTNIKSTNGEAKEERDGSAARRNEIENRHPAVARMRWNCFLLVPPLLPHQRQRIFRSKTRLGDTKTNKWQIYAILFFFRRCHRTSRWASVERSVTFILFGSWSSDGLQVLHNKRTIHSRQHAAHPPRLGIVRSETQLYHRMLPLVSSRRSAHSLGPRM